jgi:hypothetical protein
VVLVSDLITWFCDFTLVRGLSQGDQVNPMMVCV